MKIAGVVILIVGLIMTLTSGYTYLTKEKVVDIGDIEVTADRSHTVNWQPYVGIAILVVGGAMLLMGGKKSLAV